MKQTMIPGHLTLYRELRGPSDHCLPQLRGHMVSNARDMALPIEIELIAQAETFSAALFRVAHRSPYLHSHKLRDLCRVYRL